MLANSVNRYSVGDRTGGLVVGADGSVTIELPATPPPPERASANWLPVAADTPFYLMIRLYRPQPSVFDRTWLPPAIERID